MRVLASSIIAGALLLQGFWVIPSGVRKRLLGALAGPRLVNAVSAPISYPFVDYPMYSTPHHRGEPVPQLRLIGMRSDGSEFDLDLKLLGGSSWHLLHLMNAILASDSEGVQKILDSLESHLASGLTAVRVENEPMLWGEGPRRVGERSVLSTVRLQPQ